MSNACDFHVHSGYSTWDGFSSPKSVVARAVELGWGAVSLTEHGWLGSAPALYAEAKKAGIATVVILLIYVYISSIVFFLGAQIDAIIRRRVEGNPQGRRGQRRRGRLRRLER